MPKTPLPEHHRPASRFRLLAFPLLFPVAVTAAVYQWKDAEGRLHFGDRPPASVKEKVDQSARYQSSSKQEFFFNPVDYTLSPELENQLQVALKQIFLVYNNVFKADLDENQRFTITLYGNTKKYRQRVARQASNLENPDAFFSPITREIVVNANRPFAQVLPIILHECSHAILNRISPHSPPWLNEGLAVYFSEIRVAGLGATIPAPRPLRQMLSAYRIPLETLLTPSLARWQQLPSGYNYAESWALVYYLMNSPEGKNRLQELFARMPASSNSAASFTPAQIHALSPPYETFRQQLANPGRVILPHRF